MSFKNKTKYKAFYGKKRHLLQSGVSGFLCTCNSKLKEKDCIRESYNILNEFADILYGPERDILKPEAKNEEPADAKEVDSGDGEHEDVDELLKKEIESIKSKSQERRFQVVESGANGIVFIKTTVPDPVKLAHTIVTSSVNVQKSKYLLRLLPVEITCKAYLEDICNACNSLFDKYFTDKEKSFGIIYNHRNNDRLNRDELIEKVADLVHQKNNKNKADLKNPDLAILIEVIRSICCISVVPDFYSLKKYNLMELAAQKGKPEVEKIEVTEEKETS